MKKIASKALCILLSVQLAACSVQLDKSKSVAEEGSPESTQIEVVKIPFDNALPSYVLAVEPFVFRETLAANSNTSEITFRSGGEQLAAKLTTALANVGNFSVMDSGLSKASDGRYTAKLRQGEIGPFILKATVTEFVENAEGSDRNRGASLGWTGIIAGIVGALTGSRALLYGGAGVAASNPTYKSSQSERQGMVGIDFRIVDGSSGRVVGAFKSTGTFKSQAAESGISLFGIGGSERKFAKSALGQAMTAALNDAVKQTHENLSGRFKSASLR